MRGAPPARFLPPLRAVLAIDNPGDEPPSLPVVVGGGGGWGRFVRGERRL